MTGSGRIDGGGAAPGGTGRVRRHRCHADGGQGRPQGGERGVRVDLELRLADPPEAPAGPAQLPLAGELVGDPLGRHGGVRVALDREAGASAGHHQVDAPTVHLDLGPHQIAAFAQGTEDPLLEEGVEARVRDVRADVARHGNGRGHGGGRAGVHPDGDGRPHGRL